MPNAKTWLRRALQSLALCSALGAVSCRDEQGALLKRAAGDYVREMDGGEKGRWFVRQVLTLRPDGTWIKTTRIETARKEETGPPDSGTYRIVGVTLNLRSLVGEVAVVRHYTIGGDSLFSADATPVKALTGYDIGEEIFVRTLAGDSAR